ncbi:alpha/beta hydrolase [Acidisphaera sp. S103]|uniref:alpha/beta hydrolase n=1 Tax=Acidisphaera sp. S103 TaxID=1747223 RepID=UPI00131C8FF9|nr:alpha/beta fold hydrolase [Acidisphaera sp. S103]
MAGNDHITTASRRGVMIGAPLAVAAVTRPAAAAESFWTAQYQARKGDVTLAIYRKRLHAPRAGEAKLPVLFLVHGSSISSLPSFDLTVPGAGEYSLMNVFARWGFDVWTMDFEGYGKSTVTSGNSDIASGVADLRAVVPMVERETGQTKFHFMGESSGAIRAGAFAAAEPARVERLVLEAFTYTGKGSPTLAKRGEQTEFYRTHNRRKRDEAMILSIFTRDKPGTSDPRVPVALAKAEMPNGDTVPTGTYLDMTANLPLVDPAKVQCPVLMVRGQYDGISTEEDLLDFFTKLPTPDKQYNVIPGAAHAIGMSLTRADFWHVMHEFLTMPKTA